MSLIVIDANSPGVSVQKLRLTGCVMGGQARVLFDNVRRVSGCIRP